eukprot:768021-Hanusia_phi.AAC.2
MSTGKQKDICIHLYNGYKEMGNYRVQEALSKINNRTIYSNYSQVDLNILQEDHIRQFIEDNREILVGPDQSLTFTRPIPWAREKRTIPNGYMKRFVKEHWTRIVDYQLYILRESENLEGKVWNIAPIVRRRRAFITIDRAVLCTILTDVGLNNLGQREFHINLPSNHLNNFFDYVKFLPRTQEFETRVRSISTDPVSRCIYVEKDKWVPINPTEQPHGSIITTVTATAAAGQTVVDNPRRGQDKPIIAYCNPSFAPTGSGEKAVPVKWIKRECQKRYQTVDVDEFLPQDAVEGAEVSCQMYNVDRFLKELNIQYMFDV